MQSVVVAVAFAILGVAVNFLPEPIITEGLAAFGGIFAIALSLLFSPRISIPLILVIFAPLWWRYDNYLALLVLSAQPFIAALTCYKKGHFRILMVAGLCWSLVALPALLFIQYILHEQIFVVALTSAVVTWLSGITAVVCGHLIYLTVFAVRPLAGTQPVSFSPLLTYFFAAVFFTGNLVVNYLHINSVQVDQMSDIELYMRQRTLVLSEQLDSFIIRHRAAIVQNAGVLSSQINDKATFLQLLARANPDFLTLLITDDTGEITQAFPPRVLQRAKDKGMTNVRQRQYFSAVASNNAPFISEAFKGRGFGEDIIVAISAPILNEQKQFSGILEGSLSLQSFAYFDAQNIPGFAMLIQDGNDKVIYASPALGLSPMSLPQIDVCREQYCAGLFQLNNKTWLHETESLATNDWKVSLYYDVIWYERLIGEYTLRALALLIVVCLLGIMAGFGIAWLLAGPLKNLAEHFKNLNPAMDGTLGIDHDSRLYLQEISALDEAFFQLQERLRYAFGKLASANQRHQQLNNQLEELNTSLESRVKEKTVSLESALQDARQASKAKTEFLANMSHEIRTPMNGIIGNCDNLLEQPLDEVTHRRVNTIAQSASQLLMILDAILDLSKIEAGKMTAESVSFHLPELLNNALSTYQQSARQKSNQLKARLGKLPEYVNGDPSKISQILNNLLSNAIKFTCEGTVTLDASYAENMLTLAVSDTGIGISEENQQKIFNEFEQADASTTRHYGGTGLGLAITQKLVKLLNGVINVDSKPGKGATFTIHLPLNVSAEPQSRQSMPTTTKIKAGALILVVEDNDVNAQIVIDMLSNIGAKSMRVAEGETALNVLAKRKFDVILMDCQMPVKDGFETTRCLRSEQGPNQNTPVIALTANAFNEDRDACLAAGMNLHLSKPIKRDRLIAALGQLLAE
ncbi:response regulator [Salinimonas sp. HHU 13199]|uniref:histidine kinase n=1 Tax=Salinimonas profundi TaxID=2729140 RepID=A0ABR8LKP9_9ALTE|nr:ATP-binding protein [Salinimonas profundi]MBD3586772.1 response regulator [Salinimonas profundi]